MFLKLKSLKVAKKKNIKSKVQTKPHISEKLKISGGLLKQKYINGSIKSNNIQKFWPFPSKVSSMNFKNTTSVSAAKKSAKSITGNFKKFIP